MKPRRLGAQRLISLGVAEKNAATAVDTSSAPAASIPVVGAAAAVLAAEIAEPMPDTSLAVAASTSRSHENKRHWATSRKSGRWPLAINPLRPRLSCSSRHDKPVFWVFGVCSHNLSSTAGAVQHIMPSGTLTQRRMSDWLTKRSRESRHRKPNVHLNG